MGVRNSSTFDFAEIVDRYLREYGVSCMDAVSEAITEVSGESVKKLRAESAAMFGRGEYSQGWTRTLERGRMRTVATVHGKKPTYALAHLLEHGHVSRNGTGRSFGNVPGREHIAKVAQWAEDETVDRAIQKLEAI